MGALAVSLTGIGEGIDKSILATNLAVFYALMARSLTTRDEIVYGLRTYFTVETLFLLFYFLIFYWPYQQYLLGVGEIGASRFLTQTFVSGSNAAVTLATIGALAFSFGYRSIKSTAATRSNSIPEEKLEEGAETGVRLARLSTFGLICAIAVYLGLGLRTEGEGRYTNSASGGYLAETVSTLILVFAMVVLATWIYLRRWKQRPGLFIILGVGLAAIWSLRMLALGDRNSFLLLALVAVAGVFTFLRSAPFVILLALFIAALVTYSAVEVLRSQTTSDLWSALGPTQGAGDESSFNITTVTLRAAVLAVPGSYDFAWGEYKLIGLLGPIPFARGLYVSAFQPSHATSAEFLGDLMLGPGASWNVGSNVIADAYLDLGLLGVVLTLAAVGLVAKLVRNLAARSPASVPSHVMYLVLLPLLAELPRYSVDFPFRVVAWAGVLTWLATKVGKKSRSRGDGPRFRSARTRRS
ncbi:O-antigen polysaccharide polymerase Wzy [Microbacterium schleiferi]|uniref:O-antigen polysaccharide polymerase Wzy n=1 Tax=Microbacterium schleiferi TaxID=69362 RepID=A0ABU7V2Y4_9MICO